jgi:hypothetical protein
MALQSPLSTSGGNPAPPVPGELFDVGARVEEQLHPRFRLLRHRADLAPARDLMCELHSCAFCDAQPNYAVRFQSGDFDGALFRLFLFALFDAAGHRVDIGPAEPAFVLSKGGLTAAVDAFTVGEPAACVEPQVDAPLSLPSLPPEWNASGVGGSLFRSLQCQPWRLPQAAGRPFVIAIQDFDHLQMAGGAPPAALLHFLFGGADHARDPDALFPHGFFGQQEAEHISAILFCNDATIAKFNRLGQERHAADAARMLRHGACLANDGDANTLGGYVYEVGRRNAGGEAWNEGTVLIHNPFAAQPLPADWLGASAEMALREGRVVERFVPGFHPVSSHTEMVGRDAPAWWIERRTRLLAQEQAVHPAR